MQKKAAVEKVDRDEPGLVVTSPRCTAYSTLLNFGACSDEHRKRLTEECDNHLDTALDACEKQLDGGRYFLHEAPHAASSWKKQRVEDLMNRDGVLYVRNDQCASGQTTLLPHGEVVPARKVTGWLTNSEEIARSLSALQCPNRLGDGVVHKHGALVNGRAKDAENYAEELVTTVLV